MVQGRPTDYPNWASSPPPSTITVPNSTVRNAGFDNTLLVRRQYLNWLFNLEGQWIEWFDRSTFRTSDMFADQAIPGGTPPALGAGLSILAGAFSARVYLNGYAIALTTSPAHTYAINSDVYWDLSDQGWTPVTVAAGAGAPALTANSYRVYKVTTNGTDRITLVDYRRADLKIDAILNIASAKIRAAFNPETDNIVDIGTTLLRFAAAHLVNAFAVNAEIENLYAEKLCQSIEPDNDVARSVGGVLKRLASVFSAQYVCAAPNGYILQTGATGRRVIPGECGTITRTNAATPTDFFASNVGYMGKGATANISWVVYPIVLPTADAAALPAAHNETLTSVIITGSLTGTWTANISRCSRLFGAPFVSLISTGAVTLTPGANASWVLTPDQNQVFDFDQYTYRVEITAQPAATGAINSVEYQWTTGGLSP